MKKPKPQPVTLETILNGLPVTVFDLLEQSKANDVGGLVKLLWFAFQLMPTTPRHWSAHTLTPENFNVLVMHMLTNYMGDKKIWTVDFNKLRLQARR